MASAQSPASSHASSLSDNDDTRPGHDDDDVRYFRRMSHPSAQSFPAYLYPGGTYSLSGIAMRSSCLGFACAAALATAWALRHSYAALPLFIANLAFFHFMEFWCMAAYNTRRARTDSFILTSNGSSYQLAHTAACVEYLLEAVLLGARWKTGAGVGGWGVPVGLTLIVMGQAVRSLAMRDAGSNFSHYVASRHEQGHVLVQHGVYRFVRHPSYFGFFWWGLGTQIMLGNPVCFLAYMVILWRFFSGRIERASSLPPSLPWYKRCTDAKCRRGGVPRQLLPG